MTLNKIGYGTWPLAGHINKSISYGKVNDEESKKSLLLSLNLGINFYDTSDFYGYGHVEKLIGDVFENSRTKINICTKGGFISNDGKQNFDTTYLLNTLKQSLINLKTSYVDVYMLHSPTVEVFSKNTTIDFLKRLIDDGYTKEIGVSIRNPDDGIDAIKCGYKIIEVNYNILDIRIEENGLLQLCKENNVKTIIRTPLAQGILSGKFTFNDDASDIRNKWSKSHVDKQTKIFKKMMEVLNPNDYTFAQNCLRFCLSNNDCSVIIPGMKTENEVIENIKSINLPVLTEEELFKIKQIYKEEKL